MNDHLPPQDFPHTEHNKKTKKHNMKYVAAFLLARMTKDTPTAADVKSILESVDCKVDDARLKEFLEEVEGKSVDDLMAEGAKLMQSVGGGGGGKAAAGGAAPAGGDAPAEAKKAEPAAASEEDEDMGFGLFD